MSNARNLANLLNTDTKIETADITYPLTNFSSTGIDDNADATAITINSSETVMIGRTSTGYSNTGAQFTASGAQNIFVADGDYPLGLNRQNDSGIILDIRHDGTTVGSIQERFNNIQIGTGETNLLFNNGANEISPSSSSGGTRDNTTDLGANNRRWKDVYVGSSIRVGGTGTANALDDYEEGTFDVIITGTTSGTATGATGAGSGASYIKIGNTVFYRGYFANPVISGTLSGDLRIGLPFTNANNDRFDNGAGGFVVGTREISSGSTTNIITLKSSRGDNFARLRRCFTLNNRSEDVNLSQATASINTSTLIWFQGILKL